MAIDRVTINCPHCNCWVSLSQAMYSGYGEVDPGRSEHIVYAPAIWTKERDDFWWIGLCNKCDSPVLVHNDGDIVYPSPLPNPGDISIPEQIRADLYEAKLCFSFSAYRGCAVLARRALQATCIDKGAPSTMHLEKQIEWLKDKGLITDDLKEWATVVRWVGNDAAHPDPK